MIFNTLDIFFILLAFIPSLLVVVDGFRQCKHGGLDNTHHPLKKCGQYLLSVSMNIYFSSSIAHDGTYICMDSLNKEEFICSANMN